jgi:hypothetical protein
METEGRMMVWRAILFGFVVATFLLVSNVLSGGAMHGDDASPEMLADDDGADEPYPHGIRTPDRPTPSRLSQDLANGAYDLDTGVATTSQAPGQR